MKLAPARLPVDYVPRHRLERMMRESTARIVSVVAPIGYGKTTLLAAVYESMAREGHPVAWIHLDENDNGYNFWVYLLEALKVVDSTQDFNWVQDSDMPNDRADEHTMLQWVNGLLNQIASIETPFTIFLDNFHVIQKYNVNLLIRHVFAYMPENMQLFIASRERIPFSMSHMLMRDEALALDQDDLALTFAETADLLGVGKGPEALSGRIWEIQQATRGWVTAVKAIGLAGVRAFPEGSGGAVSITTKRAEALFSFFGEEILDHLGGNVRDFLLRASFLTEITGELCDYALDGNGSAGILQELEARALFVQSIPAQSGWYRLHPLFCDYLRDMAMRDRHIVAGIETIHGRAAAWLDQHGYEVLALPHLLAAEDFDRYLTIVEKNYCHDGIRASFALELAGPLSGIPRVHLYRHPRAMALLIIILFHLGEVNALDDLILDVGSADELFDQDGEHPGWNEKDECLVRCLFAYERKDYRQAVAEFERALAIERIIPDITDGFFMILAARSYLALGEKEPAIEWLRESVSNAQMSHLVDERLVATNELSRTLAMLGYVQEAENVLMDGIRYGESMRAYGDALTFLSFSLAFLQREWGSITRFNDILVTHSDFISAQIEHFTGWLQAPDFFLELSNCYKSEGREEMATACYRVTKDLMRSHLDVPFLSEQVVYARVKYWLAMGDVTRVRGWIGAHHRGDMGRGNLSMRLDAMIQSLTYVIEDEPLRLLQFLEEYVPNPEKLLLAHFRVDYHILRAWAHLRLGNREQALVDVLQCISRASAFGFKRTVVDWGPWLVGFLDESLDLVPEPLLDYTRALVELGHGVWDETGKLPAWQRPASLVVGGALSERELEVLELLCVLHTTPEIACILDVSLSTAKSHVNSIYRKLGVHTRIEAIDKGCDLLGIRRSGS